MLKLYRVWQPNSVRNRGPFLKPNIRWGSSSFRYWLGKFEPVWRNRQTIPGKNSRFNEVVRKLITI